MFNKSSDIFGAENKLLTTKDVMAYLNISRTKLWELTKNGEIPAFKVGGEFRYKAAEILDYLEKNRVKAK
jgi:excisionase family DNA binding protein